jgi:hypothetical protein
LRPDERAVDFPAPEARDQQWRVSRLRRGENAGIAPAVGADDAGNERLEAGRNGEAQVDASGLAAHAALYSGLDPLHLVEDPACLIEQQRTGLGESTPRVRR